MVGGDYGRWGLWSVGIMVGEDTDHGALSNLITLVTGYFLFSKTLLPIFPTLEFFDNGS
jgi:hypothetical protein